MWFEVRRWQALVSSYNVYCTLHSIKNEAVYPAACSVLYTARARVAVYLQCTLRYTAGILHRGLGNRQSNIGGPLPTNNDRSVRLAHHEVHIFYQVSDDLHQSKTKNMCLYFSIRMISYFNRHGTFKSLKIKYDSVRMNFDTKSQRNLVVTYGTGLRQVHWSLTNISQFSAKRMFSFQKV